MAGSEGRLQVLLIEDDETISRFVTRVLEEEGMSVEVASNGVDGLRRFYELEPDLVLLDVRMPMMDGWEVLERIRQASDCPVLMLTGMDTVQDVVKGLDLGADDYVTKPFGVQELVARVKTLLRRSGRQ